MEPDEKYQNTCQTTQFRHETANVSGNEIETRQKKYGSCGMSQSVIPYIDCVCSLCLFLTAQFSFQFFRHFTAHELKQTGMRQ